MDKKVVLASAAAVVVLLGFSVASGRLHLGGHKAPRAASVASLPPPLSDKDTALQPPASLPPDSNAAAANAMLASLTSSSQDVSSKTVVGEEGPGTSVPVRPGEFAQPAQPSGAPASPSTHNGAISEGGSAVSISSSPADHTGESEKTARLENAVAKPTAAAGTDAHPVEGTGATARTVDRPAVAPDSSSVAPPSGQHGVDTPQIGTVTTLPTGQDLMKLQGELSVIQKRQAIASAEEAIATANLNAAKAKWELAQIGRSASVEKGPTVDRTPVRLTPVVAEESHSAVEDLQLVGTSTVGSGVVATVRLGGRLTDVREGSLIAGSLVEKVTLQSLVVLDHGRLRSFYLN